MRRAADGINTTGQYVFDGLFSSAIFEEFTAIDLDVKRTVSGLNKILSNDKLTINGSAVAADKDNCCDIFYQSWLKSQFRSFTPNKKKEVRIVDLFAGCGGMTLGLSEACRANNLLPRHVFAAEHNIDIANVYQKNFHPESLCVDDVSEVINGVFGGKPTASEQDFAEKLGRVDMLCGGPPCQGHSDLNNYTRRNDPRNSLFFIMARAAEILRPKCIIIENVPGVLRDRTGNFDATLKALETLGYHLDVRIVGASKLGVPQSRKRAIIFAAQMQRDVTKWANAFNSIATHSARSAWWAIADLADTNSLDPFDQPSVLSEESKRRVDWLFDNSAHELPDDMRPRCHKFKKHSYKSVYGRMYENRPAPTITTGFLVMGQGRFIHPTKRRTITPHEGARLQTFPDYFDFGKQNRTMYSKMIGNAVPPLMAYYLGLVAMNLIFHQLQ